MNVYTRRIPVVLICIMALISVLTCQKASAPADDKAKEEAMDKAAPAAPGQAQKTVALADNDVDQVIDGKKARGAGITGTFLVPLPLGRDRLLEYQVTLVYDCRDVLAARRRLIELVPKYGFIRNSASVGRGTREACNAEVAVRSEMIYDALRDFEGLGNLVDERIKAVDHTEEMALKERTVKREDARILRRGRAAETVTGQAKTWKDVEESLEESENKLDEAEQSKWKIRDSVRWATVTINLRGSEGRDIIEVPRYINALIGLVNGILVLLYGLLWILPVVVVAGLLYWHRQKLKDFVSWFKKRKD